MNCKAAKAIMILLASFPGLSHAQDFSADVAYSAVKPAANSEKASSPSHTSKIFVSKEKIRLENRGVTGTVLLVDEGENTTFALFPSQKKYQPLANAPAEYFRVNDPENACADWQRASVQKIVCEKAGHETVNGRQAVKYTNKTTLAEPEIVAVWIDSTLHFVIKWQSADAGAELQDIKEGPQTADLFVLPPSYDLLQPLKKGPKSKK